MVISHALGALLGYGFAQLQSVGVGIDAGHWLSPALAATPL